MFYKAAMSSSTVQQMQLPCARSDSLRDHKSRSSNMSTTTWRKGRSIRGSLLPCVCVHPQFHFTHQLLQYNILLPRVHMIEKDAALRDGGNCKLSCSSSMRGCLLPSSHNKRGWLFAKRFWIEFIGSKSKNWTPFVQDAKTHGGFYAIKLYDFKGSFSAVIVGHNLEERWRELFASFTMVGSEIREDNWTSILS